MTRIFTPTKDEAHCKSGSYSGTGGDTGGLWGAFHDEYTPGPGYRGGDTGDLWGG